MNDSRNGLTMAPLSSKGKANRVTPRALTSAPLKEQGMKFFVDTADVAEIRDLAESGLLDGGTTNPSLIAKSGRPIKEVIAEICSAVEGPVSAEVV